MYGIKGDNSEKNGKVAKAIFNLPLSINIDSHLKPAGQAKSELGDWHSLKVTACPKEKKKLGK